jgi:hypothetical protein
MRWSSFTALVGLGCVTTNVARLSPTTYESRSLETPIPLFSSQVPHARSRRSRS